jgi:twitching motility two-component system response regulator PilG
MPTDGTVEADMAIVDGHDEQAVADWIQFSTKRPMLPVVIIGEDAQLDRPGTRIDRPLLATRLLSIFDQVELTDEHPAFSHHETDETQGLAVDQDSVPTQDSQPFVLQGDPKLTALVVDDSLPIRVQMQKELSQFVGHVDLAETGERALELIASHHYDIVFLDVVLPGIDGYQICKAIKRDKNNKDIPVVMLTGKASPFDRVRGKLAGCNTYLTKPVDLPKFKEVVWQYLVEENT